MKIYHNPRCSKSRQTLKLLEDKVQEEIQIIRYLDTPPDKEELRNIIAMLDIKPEELVRKTESVYKDLYKEKEMSDEDWIDALAEHPKLIQRPIVIKGNRAVIGRPPENVEELLS